MTTILIFAGRSKRFWPLSEKSFFPICGTTLIEEQVRRLKSAGVKDILLVASEHNKAAAEGLFPNLNVVEQEDLDLGMRGALLSALPKCTDGAVMVVSANDVIEADAYKDLLTRSKGLKQGGLILARKVSSYFPGGYLSVSGKRITGIVEKPEPGSEPSDLVNIVAHVHASGSELLKALKAVKPTKDDGYEVALDSLLNSHPYEAVPYTGSWQAVKYPWHLLSLLPLLLPTGKPQIHASATIHKTAAVEGAVIIGKNVKIFAHATVMGPCIIGENTIIANNALVRGSSIGENCVIGYNTEVARSVLGHDVWTHSSYIGDSVFGSNISLGAGTTTGNLRLDEGEITSVVQGKVVGTGMQKLGAIVGDGCRTGIHTCLSPGVKIGAGSFINSMTMVTHDIADKSFVKMKMVKELDIRPNTKEVSDAGKRKHFRKKLS
jgi:bifunctional UDP-N-acetylglucosamine pyrophosphorylase/glucosamine-1-phosphate N-acetyltransferase